MFSLKEALQLQQMEVKNMNSTKESEEIDVKRVQMKATRLHQTRHVF